MMDAEHWCIAEITRIFVKGYDAGMIKNEVPYEKFKILSPAPYANLIRMNYERRPMTKKTALIVLELIRKREIVLF